MAKVRLRTSPIYIMTSSIALAMGTSCYHSSIQSSPALIERAHSELLERQNQAARELPATNDATIELTLDQAISLALRSDADIKIDRAALLMAQASVSSSTQLDNPQLRYSQEKLESGFADEPRVDVEFRVEPPSPGELSAKKAIAETDRRVAEVRLNMTRDGVASKIRALFREIAFVKEQLKAANRSISSNAELVRLAKTRASMGLGTQIDTALASVAFEEAKQDATELRAESDILEANLLRRLGLPSDTKLVLDLRQHLIDTLYTLPDEETLIGIALENRFELEVAIARIQKAEAQSYIEDLKAWPRLSQIRVGYEMKTGDEFEGVVTGGISVEIPLFHLNGGERERADAREALRKAQLEERVEFIIVEVRKQYRQVQAAAEAVTSLESGAKQAAQQATEAAKASMAAGQVDIQGLAQIESRASAVHRKWLRTLRRYHQEIMQLVEAVGVDRATLGIND